jgi:hypothetical protein
MNAREEWEELEHEESCLGMDFDSNKKRAFVLSLFDRLEKAEKAHDEEAELSNRVMRERAARHEILQRELAAAQKELEIRDKAIDLLQKGMVPQQGGFAMSEARTWVENRNQARKEMEGK